VIGHVLACVGQFIAGVCSTVVAVVANERLTRIALASKAALHSIAEQPVVAVLIGLALRRLKTARFRVTNLPQRAGSIFGCVLAAILVFQTLVEGARRPVVAGQQRRWVTYATRAALLAVAVDLVVAVGVFGTFDDDIRRPRPIVVLNIPHLARMAVWLGVTRRVHVEYVAGATPQIGQSVRPRTLLVAAPGKEHTEQESDREELCSVHDLMIACVSPESLLRLRLSDSSQPR